MPAISGEYFVSQRDVFARADPHTYAACCAEHRRQVYRTNVQVSKRIEDGAQEVADAAPRKAKAVSDEVEGAAQVRSKTLTVTLTLKPDTQP